MKGFVLVYLAALFCGAWLVTSTPLDDYVNKPDSNYKWSKTNWTFRANGATLYLLNFTSQKWLTEEDVDKPYWFHYMVVAVPDKLTHPEHGLMYISYGSNGPTFTPDVGDEFVTFITLMAVSTGTICANLHQIPNQPLVFKKDPTQMSRHEDAVIAWTWKVFVEDEPKRPEWLLRLPMTKGAVRGMDTIAAFAKTIYPQSNIDKFLVCGESKRGWTTWTTAAVDKRVIAIAPMVMDLLNLRKNLHHHYRSLGGWTFAFSDYYALNFTRQLDNPQTQVMADIIDPLAYKDRLTMPKYIITTGGDEFFIPDDSYYYWGMLPGETYLRVLPNAEHSLTFHRIQLFFGVRSFYLSAIQQKPMPKFTWKREFTHDGGKITVTTETKPKTIECYYARTLDSKRRDFRLAAADPNNPKGFVPQPIIWLKAPVTNPMVGLYEVYFDNPPTGWLGFFIQLSFNGLDADSDFMFTTQTQIIPNYFPFPDCQGADCLGTLV
ncbi:hypothetical protein LOTGIDRAFT_231895 [Lottia gigantea]|uniref:Uncharacterized protein n=1 Tax=Lottia gigantea TaxID=225164 RepID=V4C2D0_LOTGI|nr:hypothetical protein LOTGIDRAFT_231895 [Lottia gigantea]ESO95659.1 hypothetical protein LOTGIDRAFT_231895 [Lottia gigantea]